MKKTILSAILISSAGIMAAQESYSPELYNDLQILKMSADGSFVAGEGIVGYNDYGGGELWPKNGPVVISLKTGETLKYDGFNLGKGNCLANTGVAVGNMTNKTTYATEPALLIEGEGVIPADLQKKGFYMCFLTAISSDGTMVCGYYQNPNQPFYFTITDGEPGEIIPLPCPEKDLLGDTPQCVSAEWMSADGRVIAGEVTSGNGGYTYPIVYTFDGDEWSYSFPALGLFNSEIVIPEKPGDGPSNPEWNFEYYMGEEKMKEYFDALNKGENPNPLDYMDDAQRREEYLTAMAEYTQWEEEYSKYEEAVEKVLSSSVNFSADYCLSNDGKYLVITSLSDTSGEFTRAGEGDKYFYLFNIEDSSYISVNPGISGLHPTSIVKDGTVIAVTSDGYRSFILESGEENFVNAIDYIADLNSDYAQWINDNLEMEINVGSFFNPNMQKMVVTGNVVADESFNIFGGSWMDPDTYAYTSYLFSIEDENANVELPVTNQGEGYKVYDLHGVKIMETGDAEMLKTLRKGVYIINGKKIMR